MRRRGLAWRRPPINGMRKEYGKAPRALFAQQMKKSISVNKGKLNLIHAKAAIMVGSERKILTRAAYSKILPNRLAENPPVALGKPKMSVSGDEAEVRIYMTRGDYNGLVVFNMKMENDRWFIQSWKY